jgi:hypothetical protein
LYRFFPFELLSGDISHNCAVDHWTACVAHRAKRHRCRDQESQHVVLAADRFGGRRPELRKSRRPTPADADRAREVDTDLLRGWIPSAASGQRESTEKPSATTGHHDGAMVQASRIRRGHQIEDGLPARRFPRDCDRARIATERSDVSLHPLQGGALVQITVVSMRPVFCRRQCRMGEEPEAPQTIVDADEDDTLLRESRPIGKGIPRTAVDEAAAVDPDQNRYARAGRQLRGPPHVQVEAVLGNRRDV